MSEFRLPLLTGRRLKGHERVILRRAQRPDQRLQLADSAAIALFPDLPQQYRRRDPPRVRRCNPALQIRTIRVELSDAR
jgi:hypothetical protein